MPTFTQFDSPSPSPRKFIVQQFSRNCPPVSGTTVECQAWESIPTFARNKAMQRANKSHEKWRLFQIAFIVSLLPELASREYPDLADKDDGFVDLLWFAAGGGKTEAFMGIILWQAFFDRLRGKQFGNTA